MNKCLDDDPELQVSDDVLVPHDSAHEPEHVLRALMYRMQVHTYSTAFSGVDSPGTAFAQLRAATGAALNAQGRFAEPAHLHAVVTLLI